MELLEKDLQTLERYIGEDLCSQHMWEILPIAERVRNELQTMMLELIQLPEMNIAQQAYYSQAETAYYDQERAGMSFQIKPIYDTTVKGIQVLNEYKQFKHDTSI